MVWIFKSINMHTHQILALEQKVNSEISRRLSVMERKIDTFDNKIESKIDRLEQNINNKIDIMTSILTSCASHLEENGGKDSK